MSVSYLSLRGQPLYKGQMAHPQWVFCSEVLLYSTHSAISLRHCTLSLTCTLIKMLHWQGTFQFVVHLLYIINLSHTPFHNFTEQLLPCTVTDPHSWGHPVLLKVVFQKLHIIQTGPQHCIQWHGTVGYNTSITIMCMADFLTLLGQMRIDLNRGRNCFTVRCEILAYVWRIICKERGNRGVCQNSTPNQMP